MRRLAFLQLFALAVSVQAHAGTPLFDAFKTICIDTGADPAAVIKAIEAMGGKPLGPAVRTDMYATPALDQPWSIGKTLEVFVTEQKDPPTPSSPADSLTACSMTSLMRDAQSYAPARRWVGIPNDGPAGMNELYIFEDRDGKHFSMPKDRAAFYKLQATGHTWTLMISEGGSASTLALTHYLAP
jgi:hypothetical protein